MTATRRDAVRIYGFLRTAHLERFREMVPADVLFARQRYDYDASQADPDSPPRRAGRLATLRHLLRTRYRVAELNEPLVWNRWLDLIFQVAAIRLRGGIGRRRTRISAYCIGYSDPVDELAVRRPRLPRALLRTATWLAANLLVRSFDRLAFGTTGSYLLYRSYVGERALRRRSAMFEALPAPCDCPEPDSAATGRVDLLFVGAFTARKGIEQLMAAWEAVVRRRPELTLRLIGKGPLLDKVTAWAVSRPEVDLVVDPPRSEIHTALRSARALVLLSQPVDAWREQIGLPIVEGLEHGLEIVTTSETGLAEWLHAHGHVVLPPTADAEENADGLLRALDASRGPSAVLADLPDRDQRNEADRWMLLPDYPLGTSSTLP